MTTPTHIPEFGIKRDNEERRDGGCAIVFDPSNQKFAVGKHLDGGFLRLFSGGVDEGEDIVEGTIREVKEESGLYDFAHCEIIGAALAHYHNVLRKVNRVAKATCLLLVVRSTDSVPVKLEEHEKFRLVWVTEEELQENWKHHNHDQELDHWFYFLEKATHRLRELGHIV